MRFVILLFLVIHVSSRITAQEPYQTIRLDTVLLKQGYILTINNHSYISEKDTVLYISSVVPYKLEKKRADGFYERLDSTAQFNKLIREIRNMIIARKPNSETAEKDVAIKSESAFVPYENKIIRNIIFKQLDVFGPTIEDTMEVASGWLERSVNKLHIKTKPYLLRNNLIIKEGEQLDPLKLADNERLLREASYIHDAKIYVKEISPDNDSVDIYIVIKDVWSKAFDLKINNIYGGMFSIWDRNIFGLGHENQNNIFWSSKENSAIGYEGIYSIPNLGGSFIRGKALYLNKFGTKSYGVSFDRDFYTPNTKFAGGLSFIKTNKPDYFIYQDTTRIFPVEFTKSDFWLGRSFPLNTNDFDSRKNLTLSVRVTNTDISKRPLLTENEFYRYHNRTLYLSSISFTRQSFYKSNLIYNFGRTEDIPSGLQIEVTGGFEMNEFKNRTYTGARFGWANYRDGLGYMSIHGGFESFFNADRQIEQGLIHAGFRHFTPLLRYKKFKFRHFLDIDYTNGINRYSDEFLSINNGNGLNGFINDSLRANKRFNLHFESVCFSPWYFYDFRFVFFASAELSIFGNQKDLWSNPLYSGFSLGVRIRNERLVFNTLELRLHIYPNKPPYSNTSLFSLSGEQVLSLEKFNARAPEISAYR